MLKRENGHAEVGENRSFGEKGHCSEGVLDIDLCDER